MSKIKADDVIIVLKKRIDSLSKELKRAQHALEILSADPEKADDKLNKKERKVVKQAGKEVKKLRADKSDHLAADKSAKQKHKEQLAGKDHVAAESDSTPATA